MRYSLDIRHEGCRALLEYWEHLRAGNELPSHAQVSPRAFKDILPMVFMLDVSNPEVPRYRLAGTQLCQQFGRGLSGVPFFATWEESSANVASAVFRIAQDQRVPVKLEILATFGDQQMVEVEIVLAPLTFGEEGVVRFIGAMHIANTQPVLYSGTVRSQRVVATQVAQHQPILPYEDATRPAMPAVGDSAFLRAFSHIVLGCRPVSSLLA